MARYYSTNRPIMPGGIPGNADIVEIRNFDRKVFCREIGREAWGYIECRKELPDAEVYELTPASSKTYYCVTSSVDDRGVVRAVITAVIDAAEKPEDSFKRLKRKDIYVNWFGNLAEAKKLIADATKV